MAEHKFGMPITIAWIIMNNNSDLVNVNVSVRHFHRRIAAWWGIFQYISVYMLFWERARVISTVRGALEHRTCSFIWTHQTHFFVDVSFFFFSSNFHVVAHNDRLRSCTRTNGTFKLVVNRKCEDCHLQYEHGAPVPRKFHRRLCQRLKLAELDNEFVTLLLNYDYCEV